MNLLSGGDHRCRFRRAAAAVISGTLIVGSIIVPDVVAASEAASIQWGTEKEEGLVERAESQVIIKNLETEEMTSEEEVQSSEAVAESSAEETSTVHNTEESSQVESSEEETADQSTEKESSAEQTVDQSTEKESSADGTVESIEEETSQKETVDQSTKEETVKTESATETEEKPTISEEKKEEIIEEVEDQREVMNQVQKDMSTIPVKEDAISIVQDKNGPKVDEKQLSRQRFEADQDVARLNSLTLQSKWLSENKVGQIDNCNITKVGDTYKVNVTASLPNTIAGNVYLIELESYEYSLAGKKPVASGMAASSVTMQVDLGNVQESNSRLFSKFVVAVQNADGSYSAVTAPSYITNPEAIAANTFDFPKAESKKGLQVNALMSEDSEELGIKHAAINFCIDQMVSQSGGIEYNYKGKTYHFDKAYIQAYDALLKEYYENGVQVSFIILLGKSSNAEGLLYKAALDTGKYSPNRYAWDTSNKEDAEWIEAIMTFLGNRYTREDGENGQIVNWILGNELNTPMYYNWMGHVSFDTYVNELTRTYRIFTTALKSCYSNVRTYLSFDYCWGPIPNNTEMGFSTKEILDDMDDIIETEGDINWNIAYHAYPLMLKDPVFWDDEEALVNDTEESRIVNMKNIQVLTNYVEENFGKDTRIILSEQGFSAEGNSIAAQMRQAASYAYGYYISESYDNIDAFIIRAHVDNRIETEQGFYFGLWTNQDGEIEVADQKRVIWDVVKYIDTPFGFKYTDSLLPWVDCVDAWDSDAPRLENFDSSKFQIKGDSNGSVVQPDNKPGDSNDNVVKPEDEPMEDENSGLPTVASITYSAHVQNKGWTSYIGSGEQAGTTGSSLRMEGLKINLESNTDSGIAYAAHVQNKGWMDPVNSNQLCGTTGKSLRIEAFWIRLTGELEKEYDIYYRTHVQNYGWLGWTSNGAYAGTAGKSLRMEAFEIRLLKKGEEAPTNTKAAYIK